LFIYANIMVKRVFRGKTYYTTKKEVEVAKRKGDRVYYAKGLGYYIVRPQKRGFWG